MTVIKPVKLSAPQEDFVSSTCERNLFLSGVGSGKSHCAGLLSADLITNYPRVTGFIAANTYQQLSKSTLDRVFKVWKNTFGWEQNVHYMVNKMPPKEWLCYHPKLESYDKTITFSNGGLIFTASLDNYTTIDGSEFGWAILDETKDTKEIAVKEVIVARLRQKGIWINADGELFDNDNKANGELKGWNPLYILTSPAKVQWLNEWFGIGEQQEIEEIHKKIFSETEYYSKELDGKHTVISSTYHNRENLPENYISNLISDYAGNQNRLNMLIYGSPVAKTGGEYVSGFDRMKSIQKCDYDPKLPIHVSFDFNVIHVSILCYHIIKTENGYQVRYFDEICLEAPRNNTESACIEFVGKYFVGKENRGLFYTGDASGSNRTVQSTEHCYDTIRRVFQPYIFTSSDRTIKRNPPLIKSRDFCNKVLAGGFKQLEVIVSPKCKKLIADFDFLKEGPDGGYIKKKTKDENTGLEYEKYGHLFDTFKYSLIASFPSLYSL